MGKETYDQTVQNLKIMVSQSSAPAEEIDFLQRLLEDHSDFEERLCLQYLTFEEQERVEMASHSPILQSIAKAISAGAWEELFDPQSDLATSDLSSHLIAAYRKKMIDLEDLATAMLFHRAYKNAKKCQFLPLEPSYLERIYNLNFLQKKKLWQAALNAKANQRYFVLVDFGSLDHWTKTLIFNTFLNGRNEDCIGLLAQKEPGAFSPSFIGTPAFGVCRKLYPGLRAVIHLAPTMEAMAGHIRNGYSDYVLHFPDEVATVHGSQDKTIFAQVHDLLHTFARQQRKFIQKEMFALADRFPPDYALRKAYMEKMDEGLGKTYPRFIIKPTEEELLAYLKDRIVGEVVDGGYSVRFSSELFADPTFEAFTNIANSVLETELSRLSSTFGFDNAFEMRIRESFEKELRSM